MTAEEKFIELTSNIELKHDLKKYLNSLFLFKDGKCLFQIYFYNKELKHILVKIRLSNKQINEIGLNFKNGELWCSNENVVSGFSNEYHMRYNETCSFINNMMKKHLNINFNDKCWMSNDLYINRIEKHFNSKNK